MSDAACSRMPLEVFLRLAAERGASTVLYLVGRPPVMRIGRELQPPLENKPLTFHETQALAEQLLTPAEMQLMNEKGNVETTFCVSGVSGRLTVFYGLGAHNLVFYLDSAEESSPGAGQHSCAPSP